MLISYAEDLSMIDWLMMIVYVFKKIKTVKCCQKIAIEKDLSI